MHSATIAQRAPVGFAIMFRVIRGESCYTIAADASDIAELLHHARVGCYIIEEF
jgi:hypothetical protein